MRPVVLLLVAVSSHAITISTSQGDNSRNNANLFEPVLTPGNVAQIANIGNYSVDGAVWNQVLYLPGAPNLAVFCTMHNSCYAFDADSPGSSPLWHAGPFAPSVTAYPNDGVLYGFEVGCLATPVADVPNGVLYAVCGNSEPNWVLYELSLPTGAILHQVILTATVIGTGDPSGGDCVSGGMLSFCPKFALPRAGLTLANGNVYVTVGSYADESPFHGWLFAYQAGTLAPIAAICTSPNGYGASLWQAGGGPAVDASGNLYVTTGNGPYDGLLNFGESLLKFSPTLQLLDWFTPANWATLTSNDWDLSSGRAMLINGLVVFGAKDFHVYSLEENCLGHLQGSGLCPAPQIFPTNPNGSGQDFGIYGGWFGNGSGYFPNVGAPLYRFSLTGSTWNTTPVLSPNPYGFPGAQGTYTSNGTQNGIVWITSASTNAEVSPQAGTLRALDPITLTELWNSDMRPSDKLGTLAKFAAPTIANGKVYVSTLDNHVKVYGLPIPSGTGRISINPTGVSSATRR